MNNMEITLSYNQNGDSLQHVIEQYLIDFYYEFYEDKLEVAFD